MPQNIISVKHQSVLSVVIDKFNHIRDSTCCQAKYQVHNFLTKISTKKLLSTIYKKKYPLQLLLTRRCKKARFSS